MKGSIFGIGAGLLAGVANAACSGTRCGSVKCLGAISKDPVFGEAFCSSWMSLAPATTTVTQTEVLTSTLTVQETKLTTLTSVTGTVTSTYSVATTLFQKRVLASSVSAADPAATIVSVCKSKDARVSSACSCFLSAATTSTVTVVETATSTNVPEVTNTIAETVTTGILTTTTAPQPTVTIPAMPVINHNFENYLTTGNILPWTDTVSTTGGQLQIINGVNPCTAGGAYCAGGSVVIRVFPPRTGDRYTAIRQTFIAKPSTQYALSYMFRCLNFDGSSGMSVYYAGVSIGTVTCPPINSSAFERPTGIQFTTDATGVGELEIRFNNPSSLQYLYFYADDFQVLAV